MAGFSVFHCFSSLMCKRRTFPVKADPVLASVFIKCLFKDLHQLWHCYKRKHHQTQVFSRLLRAPAIAPGLHNSMASSLSVHRRRKGTPCKGFSLEMINETSVSCEVPAGVFFTPAGNLLSSSPPVTHQSTHLQFLTPSFEPAHLWESNTHWRPLNSCFKRVTFYKCALKQRFFFITDPCCCVNITLVVNGKHGSFYHLITQIFILFYLFVSYKWFLEQVKCIAGRDIPPSFFILLMREGQTYSWVRSSHRGLCGLKITRWTYHPACITKDIVHYSRV